jgi:3-deoxy-D-manno-octulosonate 8-phosphate phosphatase (KDO 8-P phosphatase)
VFDIDGVLTDSTIIVDSINEYGRIMNVKDGYALQLAVKKNYNIIIISGAKNTFAAERLKKLGIKHIYTAVHNKKDLLLELSNTLSINLNDSLYMGDDMPDIEVMQLVTLPCCPLDACVDVIKIAKYVSPINGGKGCVRDVIEKVLKLNHHWE